ncbi:hypothetical protein [Burkholderia ubonensis]|uniref:hypothetical protein n=1 Tax=Burkholderia ubonensis TaxID=101571 RepID=UPI000A672789|nr:hypothetical protein [Burkholderia ubonensis]
MKVTEMITLLQERLKEHGDVEVTALKQGGTDTWQGNVVDLCFDANSGTLVVETH